MSEIYLMFFQSAIALLTNFNRFLQREDLLISLMHTQMETFLNKLAVKFIRPEKVMENKEKFGTLKDLDISLENIVWCHNIFTNNTTVSSKKWFDHK